MQRSVAECIVSRAARARCGRVGGALCASLALITALAWPVAPASAQQCTPTGTNQTCTNSILLTGIPDGLFDNGTAPGLRVTNTSTGTILGDSPGGGVNGAGIVATTATVTNNGTISGTTTNAIGGLGRP